MNILRTVRAAATLLSLLPFTGVEAQEVMAPSSETRAYQMRLNSEISANLQCTTAVLTLQDRIKVLETELAKLKAPDK